MNPSQIPYGVKDFKRIRLEGLYYVDKTGFIPALESRARYLFFVRPRRFGKSLLCETLRCYYDVIEKPNFERLFGDLAIGRNPTSEASRYLVMAFDFSKVGSCLGNTWEERFRRYLDLELESFIRAHEEVLSLAANVAELYAKTGADAKYEAIVSIARKLGLGIYVIVDEYDNFTNEIVVSVGSSTYQEITHGTGFYRGWFKLLKSSCDRIFMTGVSPVTMDDLTSGFNIATNISQDAEFNALVGFTHEDTRKLFEDFRGCGKYVNDVESHLATVKAWYDGYCFASQKVGKELVFNCNMALYYLGDLVHNGEPPVNLVDANIRSDWNKLHAILAAQRHAETVDGVLPLTEELSETDEVTFELMDSFPVEKIFDEQNFKSLYYYYGIVTMSSVFRGHLRFRIPNECVRRQLFEYLRSEYEKRPNAIDPTEFIEKFDAFAWDGEWRPFLTYLAEKYRDNGSTRDGIDGEARINGYLRAYLTMHSVFMVKPELSHPGGFSDYALFPNWSLSEGSRPKHSYIIEMKYSKSSATEAEIAAKHAEALVQLERYAADPNLRKLSAGTPVHFICYEFKGRDLVRLEEVKVIEG